MFVQITPLNILSSDWAATLSTQTDRVTLTLKLMQPSFPVLWKALQSHAVCIPTTVLKKDVYWLNLRNSFGNGMMGWGESILSPARCETLPHLPAWAVQSAAASLRLGASASSPGSHNPALRPQMPGSRKQMQPVKDSTHHKAPTGPPSKSHTENTHIWVRQAIRSSMTPGKSGKVWKLPGLQKVVGFIANSATDPWQCQWKDKE